MRLWFTSDYHLGHKLILDYCNRPFKTLDEMNKQIIKRHNERVNPEDTVFHIGDFCFKSANDRGNGQNIKYDYWLSQLNGNIILLQGNHDLHNSVKTKIQSIIIKIGKEYIELIHDPEHVSGRTNIALVGHVHNNWLIKRIRIGNSFTDCVNTGCDAWDFYPTTWEEIMKRYYKWLRENNYEKE
jgi:calcineurin-like phosphoesterase family protein